MNHDKTLQLAEEIISGKNIAVDIDTTFRYVFNVMILMSVHASVPEYVHVLCSSVFTCVRSRE